MTINTKIKFKSINIAIITISDSRNEDSDISGKNLQQYIENANHNVIAKHIVKDDIALIQNTIHKIIESNNVDAIITSGGTGLTGRDVTPEAIEEIADKIISGFGELFRMLSFQKIKTSTIQSRAIAGIVKGVYVFCLPGSKGAVKDAWELILIHQLDNRYMPCNFVQLMPRLKEK